MPRTMKWIFVLILITLFCSSVVAQDLRSPYWYMWLDNFGYSDWVILTMPGQTERELLCGEWAAAVKYDGIGTENEVSMWLTPLFLRPDFITNSQFFPLDPITTWHNPSDPIIGNNTGWGRIRNDELEIEIFLEMKQLPQGMLVGMNPGGVGDMEPIRTLPYVLLQTYQIKNISDQALNNLSLFQFLHPHPNDDWGPNNYALYDPTFFAQSDLPNYRYGITSFGKLLLQNGESDIVGFSASDQPSAFSVGYFSGHDSAEPPEGLHFDIYNDTLSGNTLAGPGEIAGAMKWDWPALEVNQSVSKTVIFWVASHNAENPSPDAEPILYQAYAGNSHETTRHQMGHKGFGGDTISATPGVLAIVPGKNWENYVYAAQEGVDYFIKNVVLTKQTPQIGQCADVFPSRTIRQQGSNNIRLWWPLMYEVPGTTWELHITYGTYQPWAHPENGVEGYIHTDVWHWEVDANFESLKSLLTVFRQYPFGTSQVPLISDEILYIALHEKLEQICKLVENEQFVDASLLLGDFEMQVMDACIASAPWHPRPTGFDTGIANTIENPACCKILADVEYIGFKTGFFQPTK